MTQATTASNDLLLNLSGIAIDSPEWQALGKRQKILAGVQNCHELLFSPDAHASLSVAERHLVALLLTKQAGHAALSEHYSKQLQALAGTHIELLDFATGNAAPQSTEAGGSHLSRLQAIAQFTQSVGNEPATASQQSLFALQAVGLDTASIVLLGQLIGFVSFQLRLLVGLQAWKAFALGTPPAAQTTTSTETFVHPANLPPPGEPLRINGYTSETLGWKAWLPVLDATQASAEQNAILDASHPKARSSDFYLLLALQPAVLKERSDVFNTIMYAPGGLSRAERELATAVVSRINRCVYCLSVHAQRFEQLAKRNDVIAQLFEDPATTGTNSREKAIVKLATELTLTPAQFGTQSIQAAQTAGLSPTETLDVINASALFAWANRLMLNLGEAVYPSSTH